jgi:hypothetical protein
MLRRYCSLVLSQVLEHCIHFCFQILSVNHVLAGVFRAINDLVTGRLKSRNVHSEIVFSLSPNNNVSHLSIMDDSTRTVVQTVEGCISYIFLQLPQLASLRMGCRHFLDRPYFTEAYTKLLAIYNPDDF